MSIDKSGKIVKIDSVLPFDITHIFNGGTYEDVLEKFAQEYHKLDHIIESGKFITFGINSVTHDALVRIWRMETDAEFDRRMSRTALVAKAREAKVLKKQGKNSDNM